MVDRNDITDKYSLFEREYKRIEPYKSRRQLTTDLRLREDYKRCIVQTYNDLVSTVDRDLLQESEREDILHKFAGYLAKFKEALKILRLKYNFEKGLFNKINIDLITEIQEGVNDSNDSSNLSSSLEQNVSTSDLSNSFEQDTMPQSRSDFIALANRIISTKYEGDPLKLDSFTDSCDLLEDLCEDDNKETFRRFVLTRLEGRARECITNTTSVKDIIDQLKANIKPESSKVIEGRILALRADRSSLTKFAEQAEKLAEDFNRSLCFEGFSKEKAKEITIEKTVEMCRKSAKSDTVKAILASKEFKEPKEVIAKMIVEINNLKQDKSQPYVHKNGNLNKFSGNNNNHRLNNNRNNNGFHNNRNLNGNRNNSNSNRFNNNNGQTTSYRSNNNRHDRPGNNSNYRNNGNNNNNYRSNNDQNVRTFTSGNETVPGNGGLQMHQ